MAKQTNETRVYRDCKTGEVLQPIRVKDHARSAISASISRSVRKHKVALNKLAKQ